MNDEPQSGGLIDGYWILNWIVIPILIIIILYFILAWVEPYLVRLGYYVHEA